MTSPRQDEILALEERTAAHYDAFPFEFMTPANEREIEKLQPPSFLRFAAQFVSKDARVGEIGCGPGRGTSYLCSKASRVVALDISSRSIDLARERSKGANFVQGSALRLPFADASFDVLVSDGVIHHTPDARQAFDECVRVLKPGGAFYLGVYNRRRYYFYVYNYVGPAIRAAERNIVGRALVYATIFPIYYLAHLIKSRGTRTLRGTRNFFYDYIMTPQASFHDRSEIESWSAQAGLGLVDYDEGRGNVHSFVLVKENGSRHVAASNAAA